NAITPLASPRSHPIPPPAGSGMLMLPNTNPKLRMLYTRLQQMGTRRAVSPNNASMRTKATPQRSTTLSAEAKGGAHSSIRDHWPFLLTFFLTAGARLAILFSSQTHVHSDEAIIGLMAKHILEGRYFPFYMYGQPYNAGAAGEAYLATIPFAIFGP